MIVLQGAQEKIRAVRFSPDGTTLVAPCSFGVQVWHPPTGGPPAKVLDHRGVTAVGFTPDGRKLVLCGPSVVIADLSSPGVASVPLELGSRPAVCDVSPDGRVLVVAQVPRPDPQAAGELNAWLEVTGRLFCRPLADPSSSLWSVGTSGRVTDPPLFLPGGDRLVALERRHGVRFVTRDSRTGAVLSEERQASWEVFGNPVLSPDGKLIACRGGVQVAVYRVDSLAAEPVTFRNDSRKQFTGLAFHPSGRHLAATSNDRTVKLYDTATWSVAQAYTWGVGRLRSVAFSPDGMLAAGGDAGKIVVWDVDC